MWPWRRRERFSLEELRYLTEQLQKTSVVNDFNKESVIETLRSMAELMIWGDQHDSSFFEFFMEKQVMALFLHILKLSTHSAAVAVQLLQSISIMIQNIHSEHAIYFIFSNGYLNHFITYPFDFHHEELLAYYISFLRTISTKLDRTTISFFIRTEHDVVVSFPLYTEAIKFFRHEESMVRIAVRALTLNVYHVDDKCVREFVTNEKAVGYIADVVKYLMERSGLNLAERDEKIARVEAVEAEEILDYCNDVICSGIPDLSRVMTDKLLQHVVLPLLRLLIPGNALTALHSLTRVLTIIKHKPLANGIAMALICKCDFPPSFSKNSAENGFSTFCPRKVILSCVDSPDEELSLASLSFFVALLRNEVDDSILDVIGLLPRLKQHKRRLLKTLMGNNSDEELLFSPFSKEASESNGNVHTDLSLLLDHNEATGNVKGPTGVNEVLCCNDARGSSFRTFEIVDRFLELLCKTPPPCFQAMCYSGALLWHIFPDERDQNRRIDALQSAMQRAKEHLLRELDDCWCDVLPLVLMKEWKARRKALETLPERLSLASKSSQHQEGDFSSSAVAERMRNSVKVFTLLRQLHQLLAEGAVAVPDIPANGDQSPVKIGMEMELNNAIPCRIAFERGKEQSVHLIPVTRGVSGWLVLAEEIGSKPEWGVVRVTAPLSGCLPEVDEAHVRWLHLRIRPPGLPSENKSLSVSSKTKRVDGRWTLAFADAEVCRNAKQAVLEQLQSQRNAVAQLLQPLLT